MMWKVRFHPAFVSSFRKLWTVTNLAANQLFYSRSLKADGKISSKLGPETMLISSSEVSW
jgi:hypothetical protein